MLSESATNSTSNNPSSDLQTQLDTFGADDLNDLDRELVGDGFTLSRLLGGDNPSPTTVGMLTSFKDICRR